MKNGSYCPISRDIQSNTRVPQYTYQEWHDLALSPQSRRKLAASTTRPKTKAILRNKRFKKTEAPAIQEPNYSLAGILNEDNADSDDVSVATEKRKDKLMEKLKNKHLDELNALQEEYDKQQEKLAGGRVNENERREIRAITISKGKAGDPILLQMAEKKRVLHQKHTEWIKAQGDCDHHHDEDEPHHHHHEPSFMKGLRQYLMTEKESLSPDELMRNPDVGLTIDEAEHKLHHLIHGHKSKDPHFVKHQQLALSIPGYVQYILKT